MYMSYFKRERDRSRDEGFVLYTQHLSQFECSSTHSTESKSQKFCIFGGQKWRKKRLV